MKENIKMNTKKTIKIAVFILIISALSLFFAQNKVFAYGTWQGSSSSGMPQKNSFSESGSYYQMYFKKEPFQEMQIPNFHILIGLQR